MNEERIHLDEATLNDYADRSLPEPARGAAQAHLAGCATCAAEVRAIEELLRGAAALEEIPPRRDLWPGVRRRVERAAPRWLVPLAVAASVALVGLLAVLGSRPLDERPAPIDAPPALAATVRPEASVVDELRAADEEFGRGAALLLAELERRRGELPPGAVESFERNLEVLDRAIAQARGAAEEQHGQAATDRFLSTLQHQKMRLLQRATRLSAS